LRYPINCSGDKGKYSRFLKASAYCYFSSSVLWQEQSSHFNYAFDLRVETENFAEYEVILKSSRTFLSCS